MSKGRKMDFPAQAMRADLPFFTLCSNLVNGLDDAQMHWGGQSFFSLLVQMLISSENLFIDASEISIAAADACGFTQP